LTIEEHMTHAIATVLLLAASLAAANHARAEDSAASHRASYQLEAKGDYTGALAKMTALHAAGDNSYFVSLRTAWLRYLAGDFAGAEAGYRSAMATKPKAVEPKVGLTLVLYTAGKWKDLELSCRAALVDAPSDATVRARLASAQYNLSRYPEAASLYRKLVDEYPGVLDYQTGYGWTLQRMGKRKEARAIFQAVIAVSPDNANAQRGMKEK
jgi:tetratricopeptide (TPR) repeat protein